MKQYVFYSVGIIIAMDNRSVKGADGMQAYEGYFENGCFYPLEKTVCVSGRRRAFITILDEPAREETIAGRLSALDEFFTKIEASSEEVPEFERVKFTREVDL